MSDIRPFRLRFRPLAVAAAVAGVCAAASAAPSAERSGKLHSAIREAQQKVVKVYGAGGLRGLEAYQTGVLISPEGHVLTSLSYVLDTEELIIVLDDGRRFAATQIGIDPVHELAVLQLPESSEPFPAFELSAARDARPGDRVLALSNLFGIAAGNEPVSVLQGVVAAVAPLEARRGSFQSSYRGPVYIVDAAANNPGAAGGALVDWQGRLLGVLGKELRSRSTGAWIHYALPAGEIADAVKAMTEGRSLQEPGAADAPPESPLSLADFGIVLVPDVLERTPPFIDSLSPGSPAAGAGLRTDDLIVFINGRPTASCKAVVDQVSRLELDDSVRVSVIREGDLVEVRLEPPGDDFDSEVRDEDE